MATKAKRMIDRLRDLNRGLLTITEGRKHYKCFVGGRQICILPYRPNQEGLAENTKSTFRRNGVKF